MGITKRALESGYSGPPPPAPKVLRSVGDTGTLETWKHVRTEKGWDTLRDTLSFRVVAVEYGGRRLRIRARGSRAYVATYRDRDESYATYERGFRLTFD